MLTYNFENRGIFSMYEYLYREIKRDILEGRLGKGERLPSKRSLAGNLKISVITVENAYGQLMVEGYIYAVEKKGYYVSDLEEQGIFERYSSVGGGRKGGCSFVEKEGVNEYAVDFAANSPGADNFPFSVWTRTMRKVLGEQQIKLLKPMHFQGVYELRQAIALHLYHFRGMEVLPEQVVIGAGTEYLYGLLVQLLGRKKIYGVENPGYPKIGKIYEANDVACAYVPMDDEGISLSWLTKLGVKVVHISPAHHFPTGRVMPIRRRQELLRWAAEEGERYIIEDDYDSEFRFTGRPIQPLQSIDRKERVVYMNTFSKTIAPSIRISYMVLPLHLMDNYRERLGFYACTVPSFEQYTLAAFMKQGYLEQHINRMRNYYRIQRDSLIGAIKGSAFSSWVKITEEDAGLHFLLEITSKHESGKLQRRAAEEGIRISWLNQYYHGEHQEKGNVAVINYSAIQGEEIPKAVQRLEKVIMS